MFFFHYTAFWNFSEKRNKVNTAPVAEQPVTVAIKDIEPISKPPVAPPKFIEVNSDDNTPSWRKITAKSTQPDATLKNFSTDIELFFVCFFSIFQFAGDNVNKDEEPVLRRANSFKNDPV